MSRPSFYPILLTRQFYERGDMAVSSKNIVIARRVATRQSRGNREIFYVTPGLLRFARNDRKKDGLHEKIWEGMTLRLMPLSHRGL